MPLIEPEEFAQLWDEGAETLRHGDPVLATLIERYREERLEPHGDLFHSLVRAIVGQQISVIASERIWQRLADTTGVITPEAISRAGFEAVRACGLTRNKARFITSAARTFPHEDWKAMGRSEARQRLLRLKGVGPWTADMVMIFACGDLDVLPATDIGLQRAVADLYGGPRSPAHVEECANAWHPWCTVATWYLWRKLDPIPVAY